MERIFSAGIVLDRILSAHWDTYVIPSASDLSFSIQGILSQPPSLNSRVPCSIIIPTTFYALCETSYSICCCTFLSPFTINITHDCVGLSVSHASEFRMACSWGFARNICLPDSKTAFLLYIFRTLHNLNSADSLSHYMFARSYGIKNKFFSKTICTDVRRQC